MKTKVKWEHEGGGKTTDQESRNPRALLCTQVKSFLQSKRVVKREKKNLKLNRKQI